MTVSASRISRDARQFDILLRGGGTEHLNHVFMGMQQLLEAPTSMAQLCEAFVESSGSVCHQAGTSTSTVSPR